MNTPPDALTPNSSERPPDEPPSGPYVGPRPFRTGEPLFGRNQELEYLCRLVRPRRVVLLHSPSGAGKTSLLQAGLVPALDKEGFLPLPPVRVDQVPGSQESIDLQESNRYALSALIYWEAGKDLDEKKRLPTKELAALSASRDGLVRYVNDRAARMSDQTKAKRARRLLIFDQFEEVLNLDPLDQLVKLGFFDQLSLLLNEAQNWAVFAMREDFVAMLEPYLGYFPERLSARFRLELLGKEAAGEAIRRPARRYGVSFQAGAANWLIEQLSRMSVLENNQVVNKPGPFVEPVQLQVVCQRLWETKWPQGKAIAEPGFFRKARRGKLGSNAAEDNRITKADVQSLGSVDNALRDYYDDKIAWVEKTSGKRQRDLRDWIELRLTTPQGLRNQAMEGQESDFGLDQQTVHLLTLAYIVRDDRRRGVTWYELTHDRLVMPVRQANAAWRERNQTFRTPAELGINLEETGWGLVLPARMAKDEAEALLKALGPLWELRKKQAEKKGRPLFKIFRGPDGYRPGESAQNFLRRNGAGYGMLNPEKVPYYLLIAAGPQEVPFDFQAALDLQYAVGRIAFVTRREYARYALSVAACESGKLPLLPNRAAVFAPRHANDPATQASHDRLARPLLERMKSKAPNWIIDGALGDAGSKARLAGLLGGAETPAVLLSASQAFTWYGTKLTRSLKKTTGALVTQDWPGQGTEIKFEQSFAAQDVPDTARLLGLMAFMYGPFTAGVPQWDKFQFRTEKDVALAPQPFVSALPQRLLGHPNGGALAVIGLTERGWSFVFGGGEDSLTHEQQDSTTSSESPTLFDNVLERLMLGYTVGMAMEWINQRAALLSARLSDTLQQKEFYNQPIEMYELDLRMREVLDAQTYILLGDPATRLPVDPDAPLRQPPAGWQRPTLKDFASEKEVRKLARAPRVRKPPAQPRPEPGKAEEVEEAAGPPKTAPGALEATQEIPQPTFEMPSPETHWFPSGVDFNTGRYALPPVPNRQLASAVRADRIDPEQRKILQFLSNKRSEMHYGVGNIIDDQDLAQAGWGLVLPEAMAELQVKIILDGLAPLLELRNQQAGNRFRLYRGEEGYRSGESPLNFLGRHGASPGEVYPDKLPYYLLLAGSPGEMPFEFQARLSDHYAVGRLWFPNFDLYEAYAHNVRNAESQRATPEGRQAVFFAPRHENDLFTWRWQDDFVRPLFYQASPDRQKMPGYTADLVTDNEANKAALAHLANVQRPDLLFLTGHSAVLPASDSWQEAVQGRMVCAGWPGPQATSGIQVEQAFGWEDVEKSTGRKGPFILHFGAYSLGTPAGPAMPGSSPSDLPWDYVRSGRDEAFISRLAWSWLGMGGSPGMLGLAGPMWQFASGAEQRQPPLLRVFQRLIRSILNGKRIGAALSARQDEYTSLAVQWMEMQENLDFGMSAPPQEILSLWAAQKDLGNLLLLGDPAARL